MSGDCPFGSEEHKAPGNSLVSVLSQSCPCQSSGWEWRAQVLALQGCSQLPAPTL